MLFDVSSDYFNKKLTSIMMKCILIHKKEKKDSFFLSIPSLIVRYGVNRSKIKGSGEPTLD